MGTGKTYFAISAAGLGTLCWLTATLLGAETIYLRNGKSVEGRIINQTRKTITLVDEDDDTRVIQKSSIKRISYKSGSADFVREHQQEEKRSRAELASKIANELPNEEVVWAGIHKEYAGKSADSSEPEENTAFLLPPATRSDLWGGLWRSALLPGWGQMHNGGHWRGYLYTPLLLGSLAYAAASYSRWRGARQLYAANDSLNTLLLTMGNDSNEFLVFSYLTARGQRDVSLVENQTIKSATAAAGLIYLINLVDIIFFANGSDEESLSLNKVSAGRWSASVRPVAVAEGTKYSRGSLFSLELSYGVDF